MKYLIIKCDESWTYSVEKIPVAMTDDWLTYYRTHNIDYWFEVWKLKRDGSFECIKEYDEAVEFDGLG